MSRNPIQDNFVILCTQLNLEKILPFLKQERMVTTDEYEILTNPNFTTRQKREKLLIWLPRKGRNYFTNFGNCLVWSGQTELARHIGVDVALVPPAPFKLPEEPSPEEQQQYVMNLLRSMISSAPPPASMPAAYLPTSAHQQGVPTTRPSVGVAPSQSSPAAAYGGGGVPVVPRNDIHQPSSNTGVHVLLPQAPTSGRGPEPMDLSGPIVPAHQRTDRHVLRASTANQEDTAITQTKGKVFILYCKDAVLPVTFSDDVLDLADTLNYCGGFTCTIDHYVDIPPPNWNIWTQQRIEESQNVLLVCSPTLAQMIRTPHNYMLSMEKGKYYANGIVNLIHPPKFIPVYLNGYKPGANQEWLPPQLRMCTVYNLNISELRVAIQIPEGSPRYVLDEKLTSVLSEPEGTFSEVANLVTHLRGESKTTPPDPPQVPIQVPAVAHMPATHLPAVHTAHGGHSAAHVAQPQSDVHMEHALGAPVAHGVQPQSNSIHAPFQSNHPIAASSNGSLHLVQAEQQQYQFSLDSINSQPATNESLHFVTPMQPQEGLEAEDIPDIVMRKIAIPLKDKWFHLGMKLGIDCSELEFIQKNLNPITDYESAMMKMFRLWKLTNKQLATRQALRQALVEMEYGHLAQEVFQDE